MSGKKIRFPKERTLVLDILRAAKSVPAFPLERTLCLAPIEPLRQRAAQRISWTAIFLRAWALVSQQVPQLRQCYLSRPWSHLYQHPHAVASVSVHRREAGAGAGRLIFCRVKAPELLTLSQIQDAIDLTQRGPLAQAFADCNRLDGCPWPWRRLLWYLMMRWWGDAKSSQLGTFSISSLAGQNVLNRQHPLIVTTSLSFSKLDDSGNCIVTLLCDHRVLDGYLGAECLNHLETFLLGAVCDELKTLGRRAQRVKVA